MKKTGEILGVFFAWLLAVIFIGIICAFPTMWLWNWLVPELFNGPTLTFWETIGLFFLINLLIRSNITFNYKK